MIHLDANMLIGAAKRAVYAETDLLEWLRQGESFAASAIAWSEFLNGPVNIQQVRKVRNLIEGGIVPFGQAEAEVAAMLFNSIGRKRCSRADSFIAATAIAAGVPLATSNKKDFAPFVSAGLRLA